MPEHYRIAYDGQLGTNDLESIFERCNVNHPPGYNGHSLSMSDVVGAVLRTAPAASITTATASVLSKSNLSHKAKPRTWE